MTEQPTPAAHVIAQLVPALEERSCQQLRALLADHIATRNALTPPHQTLVGVATVISALGRFPAVTDYQAARENNPSWPHHSSLSRRYGSWIRTVNAAAKLLAHPPRKPSPQHGHKAAAPAAKASKQSSGAPARSATGQAITSTPAGAPSNSTSTDAPAPHS